MKPSLLNTIILNFALASMYAVSSIISQQFGVIPPGNATAIFAPSGIAFVAIFFFGYKVAPGVFLGSFIGNNNLYLPNFTLIGFGVALAIGIGASMEGSLGVYLLKKFGTREHPFEQVRSIWVFILLSALTSCLVNATIGSSALVIGGFAPPALHGDIWLTWWLGDAAGVVILAPLFIIWRHLPKPSNDGLLVLEAVLSFIALMAIGTIAFVGGFPIEYLFIPILVFIVLRFGLHGATLGIFLVAGFAIWGAVNGNGAFVRADVNDSLLLLQAFIGTVMFTALTLSAADKERQTATKALAETNHTLEKRVIERTQDLEIAKNEAESASRSKTLFIAQMSHEFRTPLNAVIGYSDILQMGMLGDMTPDQTERIGFIKQNASRLLGLINDTLDIAQIEAGKLTLTESRVNTQYFFDELLQGVKSLIAKKQITIKTVYHQTIPERILIDAPKIQQIIVNLVGNAVKFTPEGVITIEIGANMPNEWFFAVRDTGIGMSAESVKQLFEQYTRIADATTKSIEGTGLGLSITKRLVEFLGGTVDVQSVLVQGSVFTVNLPLKPL
ncbi:MAG: MASE1 domain-containing protein [Phototrophicales bacterium]|nr:MASE1 domain-containing protein [Phototrophicales bacterium]